MERPFVGTLPEPVQPQSIVNQALLPKLHQHEIAVQCPWHIFHYQRHGYLHITYFSDQHIRWQGMGESNHHVFQCIYFSRRIKCQPYLSCMPIVRPCGLNRRLAGLQQAIVHKAGRQPAGYDARLEYRAKITPGRFVGKHIIFINKIRSVFAPVANTKYRNGRLCL